MAFAFVNDSYANNVIVTLKIMQFLRNYYIVWISYIFMIEQEIGFLFNSMQHLGSY